MWPRMSNKFLVIILSLLNNLREHLFVLVSSLYSKNERTRTNMQKNGDLDESSINMSFKCGVILLFNCLFNYISDITLTQLEWFCESQDVK